MWQMCKDAVFYCLEFFYNFCGDWGLAIVLITIIFRLLMTPLMHKQAKSSYITQKLQPKIEKINELKKAGIQNVMALRGDLTPEMKLSDAKHWDYSHAVDLIRELKNSGADFCIGCACYPEVHPESQHQIDDIFYLKEKVDAGCDFMTTQMFFDNNLLYNFLYKIREAGITAPVVPGIMPITRAIQLKRAIELSGSFIPQRFKAMVDRFGGDDRAMAQAGIAYATDQIIDLYANGVKHVHLYTMNKPEIARAVMNNLSSIIGK